MAIYCYAKANQMVEHSFSDDVAICYAFNKKSALKKFKKYYFKAIPENIFKVKFYHKKIAILTDY